MEHPRVTSILKEAGLVNFDFINPDLLNRASAFGTAVHEATRLYDLNDLNENTLDPALKPYLNAWVKFKKDVGIKTFVEIEKEVCSKHYGFAGRLDRIFTRKNKLVLMDIKTSKNIMPVTGLQLAGYQIAYEEMAKKKIKERWGISLQENKYSITVFDDLADRSIFLSALTLRNWRKKWKI